MIQNNNINNSIYKREQKDFININPLQTGGRLTKEAWEALNEWGDGYSVCDYCNGSLDHIKKPPIESFIHKELPKFLGVPYARVTNGAREAKFVIFNALSNHKDDYIIMDSLAHYSSKVAAERARLEIVFTKQPEKPEYKITSIDFLEAIKEGVQRYNKKPLLVLITYPDGSYGNLVDLKNIIKDIHEENIPVLVNGAYCIGRMPFKANEFNADFIVGSGHKSMAACGPIGVLGISEEYEPILLKKSKYSKIKEVELIGCTARSASIMTLIASFQRILERTKKENWEKEIFKSKKFIKSLEDTNQFQLLGENPHNHDVMFFESNGFYNCSLKSKDGRYFLYNELKQRKIHGIKPGLTKNFRMSTYGLSNENTKYICDTFKEILQKYKQL